MRKIALIFLFLILGFISLFLSAGMKYLKATTNSPMRYCVARWKMDDNASNSIVVDSVGGYNGIFHGFDTNTSAHHADGKINGALIFDGVADYIDANSAFQLTFRDSFTFVTEVKVTMDVLQCGDYGFITGAYSNTSRFAIFYRSNIYGYYLGAEYRSAGDIVALIETIVPNPDIFNHIAVVVKNNGNGTVTVTDYFNGQLLTSATQVANMSLFSNNLYQAIGAYNRENNGVMCFLPGYIDDTMLFNKALSQDEINYLYNGGNGRE